MRVGNAGELSRYLDSRVDISLPDKSDTYSKIQAEMIIRDFFTNNGVRDFLVKKRVYNGGGSEFCVGVLETRNGDYKTTLQDYVVCQAKGQCAIVAGTEVPG
jgi:hypothetical protein